MIRFRPHHFLCTLGFEGKGYSDAFVKNYQKISDILNQDETTLIVVVDQTDSICAPCPNRRHTKCETQSKIDRLDESHQTVLGLKTGEVLSWKSAKQKIASRFSLDEFHRSCEPCSWKHLGVCESALKKLKSQSSHTALILLVFASVFVSTDSFSKTTKAPSLTTEKNLHKAWLARKNKKCTQVSTLTEAAIKNPLYTDHALALRGLCAVDTKQPDNVIKNFELIQKNHPDSPWFKDAQTLIGRAEIQMGKYEQGLQRLLQEGELYWLESSDLENFVSQCSKKKSETCLAWVTRLSQLYAKNTKESKIIAKKFADIVDRAKPVFINSKLTTGYKQKDADDVAFDKAYLQILDRDWGDAIDEFETFLKEYPKSTHRHRARFWLATATQNKHSLEKAKPLFEQVALESPLTLYGLLSHRILEKNILDSFSDSELNLTSEDPYKTAAEFKRLKRVNLLISAKAFDLAKKDLNELRPRDLLSPAFVLAVTQFAHQSQAHLTAFAMISELIQRDDRTVYNKQVLNWVFPVTYFDPIKKHSLDQNIDPLLVLGQIKQESAFEADTHSIAGASGLMQLMPFTASEVESEVERTRLLDPDTNIRIGVKYLKKMAERYRGNIACALAAYNAGPTAVDRWIKEGKAEKSFLEFIEQIPYRETRDYVGSIYRNYVWYKLRVENKTVDDFSFFWPSPLSKDFKK